MRQQVHSVSTRQPESDCDKGAPAIPGHNAHEVQHHAGIEKLIRAVEDQQYETAIELAGSMEPLPEVYNAVGVCLLRLGRAEEAVKLYRELLLFPSTLVLRDDLPLHYSTNFATALLLYGQVTVCLRMLSQIGNDDDPTVRQLQAAIARWERSLSYWARLGWRWGAVDPSDGPVPIDFMPGQL